MSSKQQRFRVAVLDDYQNVALSLADWSVLDGRATVTVFMCQGPALCPGFLRKRNR
jgi:hypothetical protein